ncbi:META domain-containing protein [Streptomyces sp. NPDC003832]
MKRTVLFASTALATAALTATSVAQSGGDGASARTPTLTGVEWRAHSVTVDGDTVIVPKGSRAGLRFAADRRTVTGHDGCNSFSGGAKVKADRSAVTFGGEYESTAMACYPPDHVDVVPPVGTYGIMVTGRTLTLTGPDGRVLVFKR